jgi:hypothetical protein
MSISQTKTASARIAAVIATLISPMPAGRAATAPVPIGDGYAIIRVDGTQSQTHAGVRSSDKLIKIVGKDGAAKIDLTATGVGAKPPDQPTWYGSGVRGSAGSLFAKWDGGVITNDSTPTASASDGSANMQIIHCAKMEGSLDVSTESAGTKEMVQQIDTWLTNIARNRIGKSEEVSNLTIRGAISSTMRPK